MALDPPGSTEDSGNPIWRKFNLAPVLVGAVVTTAITLLGSYGYARITESSAKLIYELVPTPPLFGPLEDNRLFTLSVANDGEAAAEDVRVGMLTEAGRMTQFDVAKPPGS